MPVLEGLNRSINAELIRQLLDGDDFQSLLNQDGLS